MKYWTYAELKAKVEKDIDTEDEDFVTPAELLGYFNEAIDDAESEIHTLYEDYFLTSIPLSLVNGTSLYDLPDGIYATKIRGVIYNDGSLVYPVKQIRELNKFVKIAVLDNEARDTYHYIIQNSLIAPVAPATTYTPKYQLRLVPAAQETSTNITLWYIRNANRLAVDTDICDIPEFVGYVLQYVKCRIYEKEQNENLDSALATLGNMKKKMVDTLSNRVPDEDTEIECDLSDYENSVGV